MADHRSALCQRIAFCKSVSHILRSKTSFHPSKHDDQDTAALCLSSRPSSWHQRGLLDDLQNTPNGAAAYQSIYQNSCLSFGRSLHCSYAKSVGHGLVHVPLNPEPRCLKVGKSSRHGVLKRGNKISSKNKHKDNRPKLFFPAVFARLNRRLLLVDFTRELLLFDFSFGDFDGCFRIDIRLRQTAKRSEYLANHVVISHCYGECGLSEC